MFDYTATYTDLYQITMSQVYFHKGLQDETAVFDYFFRKLPFGGGYAVFAGLEDLIETIETFHFDEKDLQFLQAQGMDKAFVDYLKDFHFRGNIYASREGDLIFPNRPVLRVEAPIIETQLLETLVLNILNYQSLVATKASRMRFAAGDRKLVDFGLRRAPGTGGYSAARAAFIGGFDATSNVRAGRDYGIPVSGTMAHSFIQCYDNELEAFRDFAAVHPQNCVLLVDTYDTLKSGVPNAIRVGKEMQERGEQLKGIRLDSGDLAYLAKESRKMLDDYGLKDVKIAASNQLDEHVIKSLNEQQAPIDLFGVGTSLVTGMPDAALDGVYKLSTVNDKSRIKLSESIDKITLPGKKQVYRLLNEDGSWVGAEAVALENEGDFTTMHHPFVYGKSMNVEKFRREKLLHKVMENGNRVAGKQSLEEISVYRRERLQQLSGEFKRFENPHIYKIGISSGLKDLRNRLKENKL